MDVAQIKREVRARLLGLADITELSGPERRLRVREEVLAVLREGRAILPAAAAGYLALYLAGAVAVVRRGGTFNPDLVPNVLLLGLYGLIGYYLLRTQLANNPSLGGWSLSGVAMTGSGARPPSRMPR